MVVLKEVFTFITFLCIFAVLLLFVELQAELRTDLTASEFAQAASIKVIANNTETIISKDDKIKMLEAQIDELREIVLVLQKDNESARDRVELVEELNDLKDIKIKALETKLQEIKDENNQNDEQGHFCIWWRAGASGFQGNGNTRA